jgi:hypothetical protein
MKFVIAFAIVLLIAVTRADPFKCEEALAVAGEVNGVFLLQFGTFVHTPPYNTPAKRQYG